MRKIILGRAGLGLAGAVAFTLGLGAAADDERPRRRYGRWESAPHPARCLV